MEVSAVVCPMCDAPVDTDETLAAHLASEHGLVDDPGTTTSVLAVGHVPAWLDTATRPLSATVAVAHRATPAAADPGTEPEAEAGATAATFAGPTPSRHVYDPSVDDARWRPVVIGVGGLVLLVFTVVALLLGA